MRCYNLDGGNFFPGGRLGVEWKPPRVVMLFAVTGGKYDGIVLLECLKGLNGEKDVIECSYVESTVVPGLPFFSTQVRLGPTGVEEIMGLGDMSDYEKAGIEAMKAELESSIQKGVDFVAGNPDI